MKYIHVLIFPYDALRKHIRWAPSKQDLLQLFGRIGEPNPQVLEGHGRGK